MAEEYRTVIGAKLNGRLCYFDLDTCMSKSLNSTATVAQYPVEKGDTVSDHMYRNARSLNLSGSFSLAGRNSYEKNNLYTKDNIIGELNGGNKSWEKWFEEDAGELKDLSSSNRLESIQKVFEYIQAKGILCTVMMCSGKPGDNNTRFKVRDNMALTGITWREAYNSMTYDFTFTEIISITRDLNFETFDYSDLYPQVYLPATKSLGTIVNETGSLYQTVLQALFDAGYIHVADGSAFVLKSAKVDQLGLAWDSFTTILKNALIGLGLGAVGGIIVGSVVASIVGSAVTLSAAATAAGTTVTASSAGGPVGLAVGAAIAAIIMIGFGIYAGVTTYQKHKRLKEGFTLIRDYEQYVNPDTFEPTGVALDNAIVNEPDIGRLRMLLEDIQAAIDNEMQNLAFYVMPDSPGDVPIQVGADALTLRINPTGDSDKPFSMQILRGYGDGATPVSPIFGSWCVESSLYDMNESVNTMYKDTSRQYYMFLFNPFIDPSLAKQVGYNTVADAKAQLSNYYVVVVKGSIRDAMDKLTKTITDTLSNQGYTA